MFLISIYKYSYSKQYYRDNILKYSKLLLLALPTNSSTSRTTTMWLEIVTNWKFNNGFNCLLDCNKTLEWITICTENFHISHKSRLQNKNNVYKLYIMWHEAWSNFAIDFVPNIYWEIVINFHSLMLLKMMGFQSSIN